MSVLWLVSVDSNKQATAFPPNFIHSLDATHMLLTALECRVRFLPLLYHEFTSDVLSHHSQTQGLAFASVHDSYWTHPCDIDQMSGIIRDTFIALHSSDVLARLDTEFRERYKGYKVPVISLRTIQMMKSLGISDHSSDALATIEDAEVEQLADKAAATFKVGVQPDPAAAAKKTTKRRKKAVDDEAEDEEALMDADEGVDEDLSAVLGGSENGDHVFAAGLDPAADPDESQALSKADLKKLISPGSGGKRKGRKTLVEKQAAAAAGEEKRKEMGIASFEGKFVDLTTLLPPLPKKGEFDVSKIKKSLYFFS